MTSPVAREPDALAPLRAALVSRARAEAERVRAAAQRDARSTLDAAQREADALLAAAREQGERDGADVLTAIRGRARRQARALVLQAQHDVYEELRRQATGEVRELLGDAGRRARLAAALQDQLGDGATVATTADGGLLAAAPDGRSVDASVHALVERALAGLDLEPLWAQP